MRLPQMFSFESLGEGASLLLGSEDRGQRWTWQIISTCDDQAGKNILYLLYSWNRLVVTAELNEPGSCPHLYLAVNACYGTSSQKA